jgi:hypothetical protein
MAERRSGPANGTASKLAATTRTSSSCSLDHAIPTVADIGSPVVELIHELTSIPLPIVATLVVERLDQYADFVLDVAWAQERQRLYPDAVRSAHNHHALTHAQRRAREWADVPPKPTDHPRGRGWPTLRLVAGRDG